MKKKKLCHYISLGPKLICPKVKSDVKVIKGDALVYLSKILALLSKFLYNFGGNNT
jgi:hypothetical protein